MTYLFAADAADVCLRLWIVCVGHHSTKLRPFVCNFQSFCRLRLLESDGLSSVSTQNRAVHSWMSCVSSCHVHVRVPIVLGELFISCLNANAGNCTLKLAAALLV